MLRTTPPREGMGVEENCFVRRIEALSFAKTNLDTGRWASGVRAMERNVPRTRSVRRPARGAQDPHQPHAREPGAPTAARPAPPPIEATAIRPPRSPPLGSILVGDEYWRQTP